MALAAGTTLGPYEVVAPIGAGGMGEVYRARDTRLDRTVAIKVLSSHLTANPDLKARFEREARTISSLQHPNICVLHDVGHEGGVDFIVMEFLEGETLGERIKRGPLPLPELLKISIEIAEALERAHRAGIIHRDLKPGNVMLTKTGSKLLDFGLAKPLMAQASAAGSGSSPLFSGAMTAGSPASPITSAGSIVGTVQYMSPEQISGVEADARSDVFAFGLMLYEMASGKRAFDGKTQASIIGAILAVEPPPVSALQPKLPAALDTLVQHCLAKDPDERLQSVHDLKLQLQLISSAPVAELPRQASQVRWKPLPWAIAALAIVSAVALGWLYWRTTTQPQVSVHSYVLPPDKAQLVYLPTNAGPVVVSPDGRRIVFAAIKDSTTMLWVRPLNSTTAQPLAGTEGANYPFWSFDNRYIGFFSNGKLRTVDANGGPPQALCDVSGARGGAWFPGDVIVFSPNTNDGLYSVPAAGGAKTPLTKLKADDENSHRWPSVLPDGKHFIYYSRATRGSEGSAIYLASLDSPDRKLLLNNDSNAVYVDPGYILFVRQGSLMAQPFDTRKLELAGPAVPIADHVSVNTNTYRGIFTASSNGILLFQGGGSVSGSQLVQFGRDGKQQQLLFPDLAAYMQPALAPDGRRLAVAIELGQNSDLWIIDLLRKTKSRLTFGPIRNGNPVWSPDGKYIYYASNRQGADVLMRKLADGTAAEETILSTPNTSYYPTHVSPDGRWLAIMAINNGGKTKLDVFVIPLVGEPKPVPFAASEFNEVIPRFSPNGKWLAYATDESGRYELYIRPFPGGAGKYQVSTNGGGISFWRADGKELYYLSASSIFAVDVQDRGTTLELGTPRELFKVSAVSATQGPYFAARDGSYFIVNFLPDSRSDEPLTLVTNWTADLRK